jgi:hypothetical protein
MLGLTSQRRTLLAEKFGDLANFAMTALVFGQTVGQPRFSLSIGLRGIAIWLAFPTIACLLAGDQE